MRFYSCTRTMTCLKTVVFILLCFLSPKVHAQKEAHHWFFGSGCGLNFSSGAPVAETGSPIMGAEGNAVISHPVTGDLLFYTDGTIVYDATHTPMPNGMGLMGHTSTTQSSLILLQPGSDHIYYIFTQDCLENNGAAGCRYSIVDMTLHGGHGDITTKNVLLYAPSSEHLCATRHANCTDWWVMSKEYDNNTYRNYLLTATGLSSPVLSTIGSNLGIGSRGQSKFSPNGKWYGCAMNIIAQLFRFDNSTGQISDPILMLGPSSLPGGVHGLGFSGDNSKLYLVRGGGDDLYQYDLSSGDSTLILTSEQYIGYAGNYSQLQLAPDGKIYAAGYGSNFISVINYPNVAGTGCGFNFLTVPIPGLCLSGLCNFPDCLMNQTGECQDLQVTLASVIDSCVYGNGSTAWVQAGNWPGPYTFSWAPSGSTNDTVFNLFPGTHVVTVTGWLGKTVSASIDVPFPEDVCGILIPNIISPNGDGINDLFRITGLSAGSAMHIFNRWGNEIFSTENYLNNWSAEVDGIYYYVLKTPRNRTFSGFVQVSGH